MDFLERGLITPIRPLKSWWKQVFGFKLGVLEMLGIGSLEALGEHAVKGLLKMVVAERE